MRKLQILRLTGYPIGLGITSVLVGGTLNRVMIVEQGLPATLVGFFFAIPLIISPFRVWMGYRSDGFLLLGLRREPYIILAALISGLSIVIAAKVVLSEGQGLLTISGLFLFMMLFHLGKNVASNTFEAMLTDKFTGHQRTQIMMGFKIAMFIGIVGSAILLGKILDEYSQERLMNVVMGAALFTFLLSFAASIGQEPRTEEKADTAFKARELPFWQAIQEIVIGDKQVMRFFICMVLIMVGTQAQDVILEPFAALTLEMSVGETSSLTAIWGAGTVVAMVFGGMYLIKKIGYQATTRIGLTTNIFIFVGIVLNGFVGNQIVFNFLVFFLGLGTGLTTVGLLSAIVHFATPVRAGLLMSVWGLTHHIGQAIGSLLSGSLVDILSYVTNNNAMIAYGTVFIAEGILLFIGLRLFKQVDITKSAAIAEVQNHKHAQLHSADVIVKA